MEGGFWCLNGSLKNRRYGLIYEDYKFSKIDAVIIDKIGSRPFHIILANLDKVDKRCVLINLHNVHADPSKGSKGIFRRKIIKIH